jgi:hypothetical protein
MVYVSLFYVYVIVIILKVQAFDSGFFLKACTASLRGQKNCPEKDAALQLIDELESSFRGMKFAIAKLCGTWELCFATDDITRSSPFFWAFKKALDGKKDNSPLSLGGTGELADSIFYITDVIPPPLKVIGTARQTITSESSSDEFVFVGELKSEVTVESLGSQSSVMTTISKLSESLDNDDDRVNIFNIDVETTEVVTSNPIINLIKTGVSPFLSSMGLQQIASTLEKFPSGKVLDTVKEGSSRVYMQVTYIDDDIRIVRPRNGLGNEENIVFVFTRCK